MIYTNHVIKSLFSSFVTICITVTFMIWISQSLRYTDVMVTKGVNFGTFLRLSLMLLPSLLHITISISVYIAVIYVYSRLYHDKEIVILKASGISDIKIAQPVIIVAILCACINYLISCAIMPLSNHKFHNKQDYINNNYPVLFLHEGVFNSPVAGLTIYVDKKHENKELSGIVIHDSRQANKDSTIIAHKGRIIRDKEKMKFELYSGNRQEYSTKREKLSLLYFDFYPLELNISGRHSEGRVKNVQEMFIDELYNAIGDLSYHQGKVLSELNYRLGWPLLCILFSLIAVITVVGFEYSRQSNNKKIAISSIIVLCTLLLMINIKNMSTIYYFLNSLFYILPLCGTTVALYVLRR